MDWFRGRFYPFKVEVKTVYCQKVLLQQKNNEFTRKSAEIKSIQSEIKKNLYSAYRLLSELNKIMQRKFIAYFPKNNADRERCDEASENSLVPAVFLVY